MDAYGSLMEDGPDKARQLESPFADETERNKSSLKMERKKEQARGGSEAK